MNYLQIYEDAFQKTGSDIEAAKAVSAAFDAEEARKAEEEARTMDAQSG